MKIHINKKATSIVEAMIIMLVITSGVTGMYNIFMKSNDLSNTTTNKIQAIQIATQGIEGITNIRDTNWLLFSSDYKNCWNTLNYDASCIGGDGDITYKIKDDGKYKIYRDSDSRWVLEPLDITTNYSDTSYRNFFRVGLENGVYTQTGVTDNLKPIYTREIKIDYLDVNGISDESSPKIKVSSIVQRADNTSTVPHKIEIEQILSNWKK